MLLLFGPLLLLLSLTIYCIIKLFDMSICLLLTCQITVTKDRVWCTCPDFVQHRLPCKHILAVADNKLFNLPTAYHKAAEFNASVQMTGQYCPSVVEITQQMKEPEEGKEVPIDQQGVVHILRNQPRGGGGFQMLTVDYGGGGGFGR